MREPHQVDGLAEIIERTGAGRCRSDLIVEECELMKTLLREMAEKLLVDLAEVDQKYFGRFEQILKRSEKTFVEMGDRMFDRIESTLDPMHSRR